MIWFCLKDFCGQNDSLRWRWRANNSIKKKTEMIRSEMKKVETSGFLSIWPWVQTEGKRRISLVCDDLKSNYLPKKSSRNRKTSGTTAVSEALQSDLSARTARQKQIVSKWHPTAQLGFTKRIYKPLRLRQRKKKRRERYCNIMIFKLNHFGKIPRNYSVEQEIHICDTAIMLRWCSSEDGARGLIETWGKKCSN